MGSIPGFNSYKALNPSVAQRLFAWHWARQCINTLAFYFAALSIISFPGFRQWRSSTDRVSTLNMNIRLPLFWSTWSPARGPDSATCAELKLQKCLAIVFSWIVENTFKQWLWWGFPSPHPPDCDKLQFSISCRSNRLRFWIKPSIWSGLMKPQGPSLYSGFH